MIAGREMVEISAQTPCGISEIQKAISLVFEAHGVTCGTFYDKVDALETFMKTLDQVEIPVTHMFLNGVYIRKIFIPKGTLLISEYHKRGQLDIMIYGDMSVASVRGSRRITGPFMHVSGPGMKRIGYAHEDTLWMDVHYTDETDIQKIEEDLFAKDYSEIASLIDREDFHLLLEGVGIPESVVSEQTRNVSDQVCIDLNSHGLFIGKSEIDGVGMFSSRCIRPDEVIAPALINGFRTQVGRYVNHSAKPNAMMVFRDGLNVDLVSITPIMDGEITVDYRQPLAMRGIEAKEVQAICRE